MIGHRRLRTEDLLTDLEIYRLWRGTFEETLVPFRKSHVLRGMWLERWVFHQLYELGFRTLAGRVRELRGLSGIMYENDVLVFKPGVPNKLLIVECKFRRKGSLVSKEQVMLFHQRIQDILMRYFVAGYPKALLPIIVSSVPLDRNAFRFCLTYGILALQPCCEVSPQYTQMVACRPPLAAMRHLLGCASEKSIDPAMTKSLFRSLTRLNRITVRFVSTVSHVRRALDGNKLEKAYFDILYRWKSVVESG